MERLIVYSYIAMNAVALFFFLMLWASMNRKKPRGKR
jgi:hypothetical protein